MGDVDIAKLTLEQRRLLIAWRDMLDDIRHLCLSLKALPDTCACGDGQLHLSGSCACCRQEQKTGLACEDCSALLAKLRPEMDTLTVDTWRSFPAVVDLLQPRSPDTGDPAAGRRERHLASVATQAAANAIENHIAAVIRIFDRLVAATEEFRSGCRTSHLRTLKSASVDLLKEVEGLNQAF